MLVHAHPAGHGVLVVLVALGVPMGAGAVTRRAVTSAGGSLTAHGTLLAVCKCRKGLDSETSAYKFNTIARDDQYGRREAGWKRHAAPGPVSL